MAADKLFMNEAFSDVAIKVRISGYTWRIPAHSLLLKSASRVFEEMLMERPDDEDPKVLMVINHRPETIVNMLRFIYKGAIPSEVTPDLLYATERFGLSHLQQHLMSHLHKHLTPRDACLHLAYLEGRGPRYKPGPVETTCRGVLERHALAVFASDLVLELSRSSLERLLESEELNVPDDGVVFWGLWRWGRKACSMAGKSLHVETVAAHLDDLLARIRWVPQKGRNTIPEQVVDFFSRCERRRKPYVSPPGVLESCECLWMPLRGWEDVRDADDSDVLCLQVSFDRDVILMGVTVEVCAPEPSDQSVLRIHRESDGQELRRQTVHWSGTSSRKLSSTGTPDTWLWADVVLRRPLFLSPGLTYALYLHGCGACALPGAQVGPRTRRGSFAEAALMGNRVTGVQQLHLLQGVGTFWADV